MSFTCTAWMRFAVAFDPRQRIGAATDDPGDIGLPGEIRATRKDLFLWCRAIGQGLEFEVVIVPAEHQASIAIRFADLLEPLTECKPAGCIRGALIRDQMRAVDRFDAERLRDI